MGEAKQLFADRCRGVTSCIDPMQLCETPNLDCLGPTKLFAMFGSVQSATSM